MPTECRFFAASGTCRFGTKCRFEHAGAGGGAPRTPPKRAAARDRGMVELCRNETLLGVCAEPHCPWRHAGAQDAPALLAALRSAADGRVTAPRVAMTRLEAAVDIRGGFGGSVNAAFTSAPTLPVRAAEKPLPSCVAWFAWVGLGEVEGRQGSE